MDIIYLEIGWNLLKTAGPMAICLMAAVFAGLVLVLRRAGEKILVMPIEEGRWAGPVFYLALACGVVWVWMYSK